MLLIDEQVLAARLGIDIAESSDWNKVLESISSAKYQGVLGKGWLRWWNVLVEDWWKSIIHADTYLRSTPAHQRVETIKAKLGYTNLQASEKIEKADSEEFWTICRGYNRPLDPVDGLMIDGQENLYPWQDAEYISIEAALRRKNRDVWKKVAKLEEERLADLAQQFKKSR